MKAYPTCEWSMQETEALYVAELRLLLFDPILADKSEKDDEAEEDDDLLTELAEEEEEVATPTSSKPRLLCARSAVSGSSRLSARVPISTGGGRPRAETKLEREARGALPRGRDEADAAADAAPRYGQHADCVLRLAAGADWFRAAGAAHAN